MYGFAESFNLSVGTAVTLAFLSSLGALKHGDLQQEEKDKVLIFVHMLYAPVIDAQLLARLRSVLPPQIHVVQLAFLVRACTTFTVAIADFMGD
eukprot:30115-Eustigmatos_ZCMA.PRE.1